MKTVFNFLAHGVRSGHEQEGLRLMIFYLLSCLANDNAKDLPSCNDFKIIISKATNDLVQ